MANIRFSALEEVFSRTPKKVESPEKKLSQYFGEKVFDLPKMEEYLSKEAYRALREAAEYGDKIDRSFSDQVASGMRAWAMENGATHYTHWFQPLNGATAEKHDAFIEISDNGGIVENFSGEMLVQQEPDASSLPSGGLRNTFEARGYTAWDPSSPAFIVDRTLCIPTIFVSYTGESLDFKTPLIKSTQVLDRAAVAVCEYFDKNVSKVSVTLGWEQEFFLVDEALYNARPDLVLTDRTLMGHASARDQQLDDHYFGSIPERVAAYMRDFEIEAHKLGIPVRTRHNEVAPGQFECAPIFEEANLAVDHNQLLMDIMKKIARHHKLKVILHEKPFKGINGSGKHNNWSLLTDTRVNLLAPGKTPKKNMQFLTFLINTIKAVKEHDELLRGSIVSAGNEYRLGANEAPPAIMSVFIGEQLTSMLDDLETRVSERKMTPDEKAELKLDIGKIPEILLDNTDRNRTSPFAFTGNRFEFRAVGSSANCAAPMIALNAAVAKQLRAFKKEVDHLIDIKNIKKDEAIFQVLRNYIIESRDIRFEGNGYSEEWVEESKKRGLTNVRSVPQALKAFLTPKTVELFETTRILTGRELQARYEIRLETFVKKIQIEARVLGDLAINHIIPIGIKYQNTLVDNVRGLKDVLGDEATEMVDPHLQTIKKIAGHLSSLRGLVQEMVNHRKESNNFRDIEDKAKAYDENVKPYLEDIRYHIDKLELIVDDEIWTLPKYRELLFTR